MKLENNGTRGVMEIRVLSDDKPTAQWSFNGTAMKDGGRNFIDIAREGDYYVMVLEVDEVSMTSLKFVKNYHKIYKIIYKIIMFFKIQKKL